MHEIQWIVYKRQSPWTRISKKGLFNVHATLFRLDEQNCRQLYQSQIATILFDPGILLKELT